ncbi:MAG: SDR family NAD(P)-dependent oxidoreductase, partial [Planctomycetota bacterium]|nr:SDR family NAD(P)-dependent oxidoreductase [Planctomycetota bacterium]
ILRFAKRYRAEFDRLDVLVLNAGVLLGAREETREGVEKSFATNVLGPYLLCREFEALLGSPQPSRVIFVSSGGMYTQKLDVEDLQFKNKSFDGVAAYAQNKRAEVILTELLAELWSEKAVTVNAMHPGWADTPGVQSSLPIFRALTSFMLRNAKQGADTIIWLACSQRVKDKNGLFFFDRLPRRAHAPFSKTESSVEDRAKLWDYCENLAQSLSSGEVKSSSAD